MDDRPREKLMQQGKQQLSDAELLGILLGSGNKEESAVTVGQRILATTAHNLDQLGKLSLKELQKFKGIGEAKAITIIAALELGRRRNAAMPKTIPTITSSTVINKIMQPLIGELPHEEFWVLYLSHSNKILQKRQISRGGQTGTMVDIRIVMATALESGATSLILAHNHPAGTLKPSKADIELTTKLKKAALTLDLKILDHLIITERGYYSFADEGIL